VVASRVAAMQPYVKLLLTTCWYYHTKL